MSSPKSFLFYLEDVELLQQLNFEERGRLITALLQYASGGEEEITAISGNERFVFPAFKGRIDRDFSKYQQRCDKNKEIAGKRWSGEMRTDANACERMRTHKKNANASNSCQYKSESESESETQTETVKESTEKMGATAPPSVPRVDYEQFRLVYNKLCPRLCSCVAMTEKRKRAIRDFLRDFTVEQWEAICRNAGASGFLAGRNDRGWVADISFLLRPDKAAKILEGGYLDKPPSAGVPRQAPPSDRQLDSVELAAIQRIMEGESK